MKNICIFGASRSGKSTLSRMIAKKYSNYHIMNGDAIRGAFSYALPNNDINSHGGIGMKDDFPNFLSCLFYKHIKHNLGDFNYILETCDIEPEKAKNLFNREDTFIVFLGFPKQSVEDHINQIKKYEKETDWTYNRTDKEILQHSITWTKKSKEFEKKCKKLDILFIDTSTNREDILNKLLQDLDKFIK